MQHLNILIVLTYCIIWLLGVDNCPENFVNQFENEIPYLKKENTKVILMRAPVQYVNIYGTNKTSWFNILCNPINSSNCYNFTDATISKRMLVKVIKQEAKKLNGKYQNIFIGGHSQGACISLYTAYSIKQLLGGVLICSGILFPETEEAPEDADIFDAIETGEPDFNELLRKEDGTLIVLFVFSETESTMDGLLVFRVVEEDNDHIELFFEDDMSILFLFDSLFPTVILVFLFVVSPE